MPDRGITREIMDGIRKGKALLTKLVGAYLRSLHVQPSLKSAPIVRELSGVLSPNTSNKNYKDHLEEKYGR
jgi:hypothetical protein